MKTLCIKCKNYTTEGNDAYCLERIWPKVKTTRSKIYNALMFECMDYERPLVFPDLNKMALA